MSCLQKKNNLEDTQLYIFFSNQTHLSERRFSQSSFNHGKGYRGGHKQQQKPQSGGRHQRLSNYFSFEDNSQIVLFIRFVVRIFYFETTDFNGYFSLDDDQNSRKL